MAKPVSESIGNILGLNSKEKSEEKKRTKKHAEKKHADFTDSDAKSVGGKKRNERRNDQRDYQSNEKDNVNSDTLQGQPVLEEQRTAKTDEKTEQLGQELKTKRMDDVKPGPSNPGKGPSRSNNPGAGSGASGSSKQGSHDQATDPEVQAEQQPVAEPGDDILDSGNQTKPNSGAVLQEQRIARTDEKVEQLGQELKTLRMEDVKPGGISRGPYHQETAENYKVNSGGSRKRVKPGCLVTDTIRHDVNVMDELALQLDYPARDVPNSQYWLHLSQRLEVPVDKRMLIQQDSDYRPSENMFAYLFAREPKLTIDRLKGYFSKIQRGDLVSMLGKCSLKGTDAWGKLREQDWETFHRICLELDCSKFDNWDDFGREVDIPDDVLGKCARSGDYAETILLIIYAKNPTLQIEEMKDALKDMVRCDVCDKLSELPENSTIQTLLEDCDVLRKVCDLLDKDEPSANWKVFAQKFGVSREECDYLRPASVHSPTKQLMEYLSQAKPSLTLESFLKAVLQIDRRDVVKVSLKKFFDHNDIDIIVDTIEQREQRETNKL